METLSLNGRGRSGGGLSYSVFELPESCGLGENEGTDPTINLHSNFIYIKTSTLNALTSIISFDSGDKLVRQSQPIGGKYINRP